MENGVIGLYGCYCHPFKNWDEHNKFHKQIIKIGDIVMRRCTREFGQVLSIESNYIIIYTFPQNYENCKVLEHKSNLIKINELSDNEMKVFQLKNQIKLSI